MYRTASEGKRKDRDQTHSHIHEAIILYVSSHSEVCLGSSELHMHKSSVTNGNTRSCRARQNYQCSLGFIISTPSGSHICTLTNCLGPLLPHQPLLSHILNKERPTHMTQLLITDWVRYQTAHRWYFSLVYRPWWDCQLWAQPAGLAPRREAGWAVVPSSTGTPGHPASWAPAHQATRWAATTTQVSQCTTALASTDQGLPECSDTEWWSFLFTFSLCYHLMLGVYTV